MNYLFILQSENLSQTAPNWFDWFSLISSLLVSGASIFFAFKLAEKVYQKEKSDKVLEDLEIQNSEIQIFKSSLIELNDSIEKQIINLQKYDSNRDFKLFLHVDIKVDFLQFIDIKYLYRRIGFSNTEAIKKINDLMAMLYALYDFRESLTDEFRTYIKKYNYHESKFNQYRQLLYTKYFSICHNRAEVELSGDGNTKKWKFRVHDKFIIRYSELVDKILTDDSIVGLQDRAKLNNEFVIPLTAIAYQYVPEDLDAIEVNNIGNDVISAFNDMEYVTKIHFDVINVYLHNLRAVSAKIREVLDII
ncbi:hypothetical protein [Flavobacterium defluvii]|uniref:Phage abortive infection protein n=1 Tax=Flavobacterium defluvii TaxID=370979 RepID=A0A1M5QXN9_9FLAO|nr:hypothetical protein [Flavobacterium defluvii]SHH18520.1 hypothetical protein SAMN05443663_10641 [Flavobacterium defluvii]